MLSWMVALAHGKTLLQHTSVHSLVHGAVRHNQLTFATIVKFSPYNDRWTDIIICSLHTDIAVPLTLPPMGIWTTRTQDNSYPGQLVPKTTHTQSISYPSQLVPRTTRTQDNPYRGQLVPKTTRTQDNSYPSQLVPGSPCAQANSYPGQLVPKTVSNRGHVVSKTTDTR